MINFRKFNRVYSSVFTPFDAMLDYAGVDGYHNVETQNP